jgi:PIN domain nuclease of toxin-antitoxin system
MRYLLDTHVFLWTTAQSHRLPENIKSLIEDPKNDIVVSSVSFWEIAIKVRRGRLDIGGRSAEDLIGSSQKMGFQSIGIDPEEAATYDRLTEDTHFDPFDRMLVWQAIQRNLTLISADSTLKRFKKDGLKLVW